MNLHLQFVALGYAKPAQVVGGQILACSLGWLQAEGCICKRWNSSLLSSFGMAGVPHVSR